MEQGHPSKYLTPTSLGCYAMVTDVQTQHDLRILHWLLAQPVSPPLDEALTRRIAQDLGIDSVRGELQRLYRSKFVEVTREPVTPGGGSLESHLSELLAALSPVGQAALIDRNGLCIAMAGFEQDRSDNLSALSSKLVDALSHEKQTLNSVLGLTHAVPCILDVKNKRPICFVSLNIGPERFVVVIVGKPAMRGTWFRDLVWTLWSRYAANLNGAN